MLPSKLRRKIDDWNVRNRDRMAMKELSEGVEQFSLVKAVFSSNEDRVAMDELNEGVQRVSLEATAAKEPKNFDDRLVFHLAASDNNELEHRIIIADPGRDTRREERLDRETMKELNEGVNKVSLEEDNGKENMGNPKGIPRRRGLRPGRS